MRESLDAPLPDRFAPTDEFDNEYSQHNAVELAALRGMTDEAALDKALAEWQLACNSVSKANAMAEACAKHYDAMIAQVEAWQAPRVSPTHSLQGAHRCRVNSYPGARIWRGSSDCTCNCSPSNMETHLKYVAAANTNRKRRTV